MMLIEQNDIPLDPTELVNKMVCFFLTDYFLSINLSLALIKLVKKTTTLI